MLMASAWERGRQSADCIVTVHFVGTAEVMAEGRFIGPVALFRESARLLPELKPMLPFEREWRNWIDLVEGHGVLVPMLRWRVPPAALQLLWDRHDEREPQGEAASEAAARAMAVLRKFEVAKAMWGRPDWATQHLHPLDDPKDGADAFVELPIAVPWSLRTYEPVSVSRGGLDHTISDDHGCVPLFRQWQALMLVELSLAGPRTLAGLRRVTLREQWPDLEDGNDEWTVGADLDGFARHRAALEALSWNAAYKQHALMLAETEKPDLGLLQGVGRSTDNTSEFVIRGASHAALIAAEEAVAREALSRHGVDEERLLAAANWLGWRAVWRRDAGHAEVGRAYANLMRAAIELIISTGQTLAEVQERMRDGQELVGRLFPVWLDRARATLTGLVNALARDFDAWPASEFPAFSEASVRQFIEWLEAAALFAAHMSVPAIADYGQRIDRDAQVGVAVHVSSLAAWVEHVCNEALGPGWIGNNTLDPKLIACWAHQACSDLRTAFGRRQVPKGTAFPDGVRLVLGLGASTLAEWMARDARLACLIRNEGLHRGLSGLDRREMHDATCLLLRTAMGVWLTTRLCKC